MKITVRVYERDKEIAARELSEGTFRFGRSEFSDVVLAHESVSRSHLELRVTDSAVYATNMSSPGRLKVNGQSKETAELGHGDEIRVGRYRVAVLFEGLADSDAPVAAQADGGGGGGDDAPVDGPPAEGGNADAFGFGNFNGGDGGDAGGGPPPEPAADNGGFGAAFGGDDGGGQVAVAEMERPAEGSIASGGDTDQAFRPIIAKLVFLEGARSGEEVRVDSYEITMGRSRRADIFLDDTKLSRVHAKIARVGNGYRLVDLDSRHGTYVNGVRVLEHPLSSFDVIELGSVKLRFLISDVVAQNDGNSKALAVASDTQGNPRPVEQTRSVALAAIDPALLNGGIDAEPQPFGFPADYGGTPPMADTTFGPNSDDERKKKTRLMAGAIAALVLLYFLIPTGEKPKPKEADIAPETVEVPSSPLMPKEYNELSPELQRIIEGAYNSAQRAAELGQFEEAVGHLKKIHEYLPYYKDSRDLLDVYGRRLREVQIADAQKKAKQDEKQDLQLYLNEGMEYLRNGDFDRAAEAFNSAVVIDPTNQVAIQGLKAAEARVRRLEDVPAEKDPEEEKKKVVAELFQKAVAAFSNKSYQEAIDIAERIRQVEIKGDTQYLAEAKSIIDRSRAMQKEEFEPFLIQAQERYAEGDYNGSRDLCEEMSKRDPTYEEATECIFKARKQLNRLAKEAYVHGYILESMNRLEEAKQYWQRGKNYTRQGDDYYDKINKKLEYYQ